MPSTNEKPKLEDQIESRLLPVLYAIAAVLAVLLLAALVVLAWKEVL
jgi:hypothetical protein